MDRLNYLVHKMAPQSRIAGTVSEPNAVVNYEQANRISSPASLRAMTKIRLIRFS
jgi:hypothetical protein